MDIELMVALRNKINEWIDETSEDWYPSTYHGEDLAENMTMGAVAVFDMSVNTAEYYEKEIYPDAEKA